MNRKQRRAAKRESKKQHGPDAALAEKVGLFSKLPPECSACRAAFDKTDREMVMSWSVVVREQDQTVRLYCPRCWEAAQKAVVQVYGDLNDLL